MVVVYNYVCLTVFIEKILKSHSSPTEAKEYHDTVILNGEKEFARKKEGKMSILSYQMPSKGNQVPKESIEYMIIDRMPKLFI